MTGQLLKYTRPFLMLPPPARCDRLDSPRRRYGRNGVPELRYFSISPDSQVRIFVFVHACARACTCLHHEPV
jgi:hypothetical protein